MYVGKSFSVFFSSNLFKMFLLKLGDCPRSNLIKFSVVVFFQVMMMHWGGSRLCQIGVCPPLSSFRSSAVHNKDTHIQDIQRPQSSTVIFPPQLESSILLESGTMRE